MKKLFLTLFVFTLFASCSAIPQEQSQNLEGDISPETTLPEGEKPGTEVPEVVVPEPETPEVPEIEISQEEKLASFIKITGTRKVFDNPGLPLFNGSFQGNGNLIVNSREIFDIVEMISETEGKFNRYENTASGKVFIDTVSIKVDSDKIHITYRSKYGNREPYTNTYNLQ